MNSTIWKYPIDLDDLQTVYMPDGAAIISADLQGGCITLWALVDLTAPRCARDIAIVGTGHPVPLGAGAFLGTVQQPPFVWHLFEIWRDSERDS